MHALERRRSVGRALAPKFDRDFADFRGQRDLDGPLAGRNAPASGFGISDRNGNASILVVDHTPSCILRRCQAVGLAFVDVESLFTARLPAGIALMPRIRSGRLITRGRAIAMDLVFGTLGGYETARRPGFWRLGRITAFGRYVFVLGQQLLLLDRVLGHIIGGLGGQLALFHVGASKLLGGIEI